MEGYSDTLLLYAMNMPHLGRLKEAHGTASIRSRLCGSRITVDVEVQDDRVTSFAMSVDACVLGKASASIIAKDILGASISEVHTVISRLRSLVQPQEESADSATSWSATPPTTEETSSAARWKDLHLLSEARSWPSRIPSVLLIANALERALQEAQRFGFNREESAQREPSQEEANSSNALRS